MNLKQRLIAIVGMSALPFFSVSAQREIRSINDGWSFRFPDKSEWTSVSIPHTYNLDAYSTRDYYKGKGEYLRNLKISGPDDGRRYFLRFDAANKAAKLTVNGQELMAHAGGYSAFCCDVTDYIRSGNNEIRLEVDNSRLDVAPSSADFTFWGGIYRDTWLITTPLQHFDICDNATSGVFATPVNVSEKSASVNVVSRIVNDDKADARMNLVLRLCDDSGKEVALKTTKIKLKPGETAAIESSLPEIKRPALWSPETPRLYSLTASLTDSDSGSVIDETVVPVGFRWFSFDGAKGFRLNGKPLKLRGINRHQDLWPVGVAVDDEAHRRDMRLMKDIGCNFVRLAHYQQDDAILDECDRLGLIVWEEIPIVNMVPDVEGFDDNCEANLVELIRQHYNHPSVVLWGYMNEILLRAPGENSPEWSGARDRIVSLANRLEKKLKTEDSTRASVMAFHGSDRYNKIGLGISDVQGWNLYQGWYGGDLSGFERYLEDQQARYPERSLIVSEWGAGSDRRLHSDAPVPFDFSMEYQQKYIEHYLPYMEKSDYISGGAYWNFIDFNVAERQESMPHVNNKGLFYNDRTPKDVAYYFKSMWREDIPVVRIAVRDRDVVISEDGTTAIKVYSNCPEVELRVNGVSHGVRPTDNCQAVFTVTLPEGVSNLSAGGVRDGVAAEDVATITRSAIPDLARGETMAINVGSNCDFTSSVNGQTWLSDRPYEKGKWGYMNGKKRSTTSEIFNTGGDTPLYQSMLEDVTDYCIDAPAGRYEVELLFTDISKGGNNSPYLLGRDSGTKGVDDGMAKMSVVICGQEVEPAFSPAESAGFQHAVRKKYIVDNHGETISLHLTPLVGKTALSAISVRRM